MENADCGCANAQGVELPALTSPSGSQEGGNEPSCRAISAEFEKVGPIPPREARGPFLANSGRSNEDAATIPVPASNTALRAWERPVPAGLGIPVEDTPVGRGEHIIGVAMRLPPRFDDKRGGEVDRGRAKRGPDDPSPLTCPMSEQLNPSSGSRCGQFPGLELEINVMNLERIYGIGRLGAMLLTFEDPVTDAKEASKRFNSLNSNFLAERYPVRVAVLERTKADRVHFHLLVVCPVDIRSGFDLDAVKRRDYTSP